MTPSPTRQLRKLSICEEMPTTRSQAHRRHLQFSDTPGPSSSAPAPDPAPSGRKRPVLASQRREGEERRGRGRKGNNDQKAFQGSRQPHQIGSGNDDVDNESNNNTDDSPEHSSDTIASMVLAAKSKIVYDIESLELESRARALAGLTGQFDVVYCREVPPFYEFQLIERPRIRIRNGGAECTCSEYENRPDMACRHIFVSLSYSFTGYIASSFSRALDE